MSTADSIAHPILGLKKITSTLAITNRVLMT